VLAFVHAHIEASEHREAVAWARADAAEQHAEAAEQRAQALEGQVLTVVETNAQLQEEQQSQLDELSSLRQI
jgi:phage-related minor tail protein